MMTNKDESNKSAAKYLYLYLYLIVFVPSILQHLATANRRFLILRRVCFLFHFFFFGNTFISLA